MTEDIKIEADDFDRVHCDLFVLRADGERVGRVILNWSPKYALYKKLGIPEIQDLTILPDFRRRGLGRMLVVHCENKVRDKGISQIGISVGLHKDFGAAQRLYFELGYKPDGYGVTYDRQSVANGEIRPVDDDLCLMMVKDLDCD